MKALRRGVPEVRFGRRSPVHRSPARQRQPDRAPKVAKAGPAPARARRRRATSHEVYRLPASPKGRNHGKRWFLQEDGRVRLSPRDQREQGGQPDVASPQVPVRTLGRSQSYDAPPPMERESSLPEVRAAQEGRSKRRRAATMSPTRGLPRVDSAGTPETPERGSPGFAGETSVQKALQDGRAAMRKARSTAHQTSSNRLRGARGFQQRLPSHMKTVTPRRLSKSPPPQAAGSPEAKELKAGEEVVIAENVSSPKHGWGGKPPLAVGRRQAESPPRRDAEEGDVGTVLRCLHNEVFVEFTDRRLWLGTEEVQRRWESPSARATIEGENEGEPNEGRKEVSDVFEADSPSRSKPRRQMGRLGRSKSKSKKEAADGRRRGEPRVSRRLAATNVSGGAGGPTSAEKAQLADELRQWSVVETSQRELKNSDTPKVVSQMGSHMRDAALQCAGCAVLFTRAFDAAARLEIGGSGAIETIVDALNSHPASAALQEQGCAALGNLAHAQPTNRARIVACGGPAAVVRGLSAHAHSEGVSWKGCAALWTLAAGEPAEGCHEAIGEAGGVEAVLSALRAHRRSEVVQEKGCGCLANLALSDVYQTQILEAGGLSLVVTALRAFPASAAVQEKGRAALWNLRATASPEKKQRSTTPEAAEEESADAPTPTPAVEEPHEVATQPEAQPAAEEEPVEEVAEEPQAPVVAETEDDGIYEAALEQAAMLAARTEQAEQDTAPAVAVPVPMEEEAGTPQLEAAQEPAAAEAPKPVKPASWYTGMKAMDTSSDVVCVQRSVMRAGREKSSDKIGFLEVGETAQIEEEWEAPDGALRVHLAAPYSGWITNGGGGRPVALMRGEKFFEAGGDLDGDGRVDKDEFLIWHLYHLGYKPDVETYAMFYAADTDGDGDVDREEFEVLKPKLRRYAAEKASAEFPRQWEVFQELDEDGTGTLSTDEVFDFLAGKDEGVANDLMTELDQNHDGEVDFREFCRGWEIVQR